MYMSLGHLYELKPPYDLMYIFVCHMINGLILDRILFDIFSLKHQKNLKPLCMTPSGPDLEN